MDQQEIFQITEKKEKRKPTTTKTKTKEGKSKSSKSRFHVDIFNDHCMENAYFICHNVQDVLKCRGFPWPDAHNKKKKGKKGK